MKSTLIALVCLLLLGSLAVAGTPINRQPHRTDTLNNVISMNMDGGRTALCICGQNVEVQADTPTADIGGTLFYLHAQDCLGVAQKITDPEHDATLSAWKKTFASAKFLSNARMKEGREVAVCTCGRSFEVTPMTHAIAENGLVVHFCSEGHQEAFRAEAADGRLKEEMAMLPAAMKEPHPSVEVIYRATDGSWNASGMTLPGSGK